MTDSLTYDVFISYARRDDADGWVSALRDAIYADFKSFSTEPFRIFFDRSDIRNRDDWELRLRQGLRSSRVLLVCLSPNYLRSKYCRWEWEEFARFQARRIGGGEAVTGVYFVALEGGGEDDAQMATWRRAVTRVQLVELQEWFPHGVQALQEARVREQVEALGKGVYEHWRQARLAKQAPGNLTHYNPNFVGRVEELRELRLQLTGGAVGVVTAVHGIGGMGKTELALTYAHAYAGDYQGGTWYVDAEGRSDLLEAVSSLARSPALGLQVTEDERRDTNLLGELVLAALCRRTEAARQIDERTGACFLLLDNVSESTLLSEAQLAVLPDEPWFHVVATTRLGVGDIGAVGSRGSVALIEVDQLSTEDAVELLREHQPARDPARLYPDFSGPEEADAARRLVELLGGYTLGVEQAAVYLGSFEIEPSQLLDALHDQGLAALDTAAEVDKVAGAIRHKEKLATTIVDQTLQQLPQRACAALAFASLLPPDTIMWQWLHELTEPVAVPAGLPGLSDDDWAATRRLVEGRRLLTPADDPRLFARLHRVLHAHLRTRLADAETERRLDDHLRQVSQSLQDAAAPDIPLLAATAATLTIRLAEGRHDVAGCALRLMDRVQQRVGSVTVGPLVAATLQAFRHLADADPGNPDYQYGLVMSLVKVGEVREDGGDEPGALEAYINASEVAGRLAAAFPNNGEYQRAQAVCLERLMQLHGRRENLSAASAAARGLLAIREALAGDFDHLDDLDAEDREGVHSLLESQHDLALSLRKMAPTWDRVDRRGGEWAATRALEIFERLVAADPANRRYQHGLSSSLEQIAHLRKIKAVKQLEPVIEGDLDDALEALGRSVRIAEQLTDDDPTNTGYKVDLADRLGTVSELRSYSGDAPEALDAAKRSMQMYEELSAADPGSTKLRSKLANSYAMLAALRDVLGDPSADDYWLQAHEVLTELWVAGSLTQQNQETLEFIESVSFRVPETTAAIRHERERASRIVDETIERLPQRARAALSLASLLPPDIIPWDWLERLTELAAGQPRMGSAGPSGTGVWGATRRILEGRRLLTPADDPQFARLRRGLHDHLRGLADPRMEERLDPHLQRVSQNLTSAVLPDTALLAVVASTLTTRVSGGRHQLASCALSLFDRALERLDLESVGNLGNATLDACEDLARAEPNDAQYQDNLAVSLQHMGRLLESYGDIRGAVELANRCLDIREQLAGTDPDNLSYQSDLSEILSFVGTLRLARRDQAAGLQALTRALEIAERLVAHDPTDAKYKMTLYSRLRSMADLWAERGDTAAAMQAYNRALDIAEQLTTDEPANPKYMESLAFSLIDVGTMSLLCGDQEAALQAFNRAREIADRLVAADPDNTSHQRCLYTAVFGLAGLHELMGNASVAADHWATVHKILETLDLAGKLPESERENLQYVKEKLEHAYQKAAPHAGQVRGHET